MKEATKQPGILDFVEDTKKILMIMTMISTDVGIHRKSIEYLIDKMKTVQPIFSPDWSYYFIFNKKEFIQIMSLPDYVP